MQFSSLVGSRRALGVVPSREPFVAVMLIGAFAVNDKAKPGLRRHWCASSSKLTDECWCPKLGLFTLGVNPNQ